jgi:hypothetical protein
VGRPGHQPRARPEGLAGLRDFLDQMWASALEVASDLVEADRDAPAVTRQRRRDLDR